MGWSGDVEASRPIPHGLQLTCLVRALGERGRVKGVASWVNVMVIRDIGIKLQHEIRPNVAHQKAVQ